MDPPLRNASSAPVRGGCSPSSTAGGVAPAARALSLLNLQPSAMSSGAATSSTPRSTRRRRRPRAAPPEPDETARIWRTFDGTYNDLSEPTMGAASPRPSAATCRSTTARTCSTSPTRSPSAASCCTARSSCRRASLNLLAAAWIQFQVHDWVNHARHPLGEEDVGVPLPPGMSGWSNTPAGAPEPEMRIAGNDSVGGTLPDGSELPLFANQASHWWDGSEVYGTDEEAARNRCATGPSCGCRRTATCPGTSGESRSPASTKAGGSA